MHRSSHEVAKTNVREFISCPYPLQVAVTSEMSDKRDHPSAWLSFSLSDGHQTVL